MKSDKIKELHGILCDLVYPFDNPGIVIDLSETERLLKKALKILQGG